MSRGAAWVFQPKCGFGGRGLGGFQHRVHGEHRDQEERRAAGRRKGVDDGRELSKDMVAQRLMCVKDNYVAIRMSVG